MRNVDIIYGKFLADDNETVTIGGIQTYITDLSKIITEMGGKVRILQFSNENFQYKLNENVSVEGFNINGKRNSQRYQKLFDLTVQSRGDEDRLTIFATDTIIPDKVSGDSVAIQHGICWDIPRNVNCQLIRQVASRALSAYKRIKRLNNVKRIVCVDYNFLNWYRTQVNRAVGYVSVIPNYTRIAPKFEKPDDKVNIIFARRLFDYRGTRVFAEAIQKLLKEKNNISVTIAGSGPDEEWMKQQLEKYQNVSFVHYESSQSLDIHSDKHIAVVPTIGSEGTSLSLLEAMSAQCAVVCTNVGGMTNIVLNGYNGVMVNPGNSVQLYSAIKGLVANSQVRKKIAQNGYETVTDAFSYEKWAEEWRKVLKELG